MPLVMLRRDANGPFKRSVRDAKGNILETLEFKPGEPQDVPSDKVSAIIGDLYNALLPVVPLFVPGTDPPQPNGKFEVIPREELDGVSETPEVNSEADTAHQETANGTKPARRSGK